MSAHIERAREKVCFHATRLDDLQADSELVQFEGHAFAPALESPFRCVVHGVEGDGHQSTDGGGVDEESRLLPTHVRSERLRYADGAHEVGVDHSEHLLIAQPFEWTGQPVASVIEYHV